MLADFGCTMTPGLTSRLLAFAAYVPLAGCGLSVPDKDPFAGDARTSSGGSIQGDYESGIVDHVTCEIANGLKDIERFKFRWLMEHWGVTVTQSITGEDQSGLAPGVTAIKPLPNVLFPFSHGGTVTSPQSFSFSLGGTASVNALRTETIQYTFRNRDIVGYPCDRKPKGILIDGDLKIGEFIYDKAVIAALRNPYSSPSDYARPAFNTWTEEITFVSTYGASATPTWKLAQVSSGTGSNLALAQRTNTNDLIITFGPIDDTGNLWAALSLSKDAMSQHFARVQAAAIAVSVTGQMH